MSSLIFLGVGTDLYVVSSSMEDQWMNLVDEPSSLAQIKRELTTDRAGWLAYHARHEIEKAREGLSEEIGKELEVRSLYSLPNM